MQLHNQHIITALNHECDKRIKELDSDSPHGDYIFYSFQDAINLEKTYDILENTFQNLINKGEK